MMTISQEIIKLQHDKMLKSLSLYLFHNCDSEKTKQCLNLEFFSVLSPIAGKYGPKKPSNLYSFYAAILRSVE